VSRRKLRLTDGRVVKGKVGIKIEGYRFTSIPGFGSEGMDLLGTVTMEALSLAPDVVGKRLVPVKAFLMLSSLSPHSKSGCSV